MAYIFWAGGITPIASSLAVRRELKAAPKAITTASSDNPRICKRGRSRRSCPSMTDKAGALIALKSIKKIKRSSAPGEKEAPRENKAENNATVIITWREGTAPWRVVINPIETSVAIKALPARLSRVPGVP